jgi:hypothetical protein
MATAPQSALTIETVSQESVRSVLAPHPAPCLSLYQPTHRNVPGNVVDRPTFRSLVAALETTLSGGHGRSDIDRLLRPFRQLADDRRFWEHTRDGLAVLSSDGKARVFLLQRSVPALALVGPRFHTLPLVRIASALDRCDVLVLTGRDARTYEALAWSDAAGSTAPPTVVLDPREFRTDDGRRSDQLLYDDVVDEEVLEPHRVKLGMGPAGMATGGVVHGGFGSKQDEAEKDSEIFLRHVDSVVLEQVTRQSDLPLVVVAPVRLVSAFRGLSRNPRLLDEHVARDPQCLSRDELGGEVAPVLGRLREESAARAAAAFRQAHDHGLAAGEISEVARAAAGGRIATLLLEADRFEPGRFDRSTGAISAPTPFETPRTGSEIVGEDEDLLNAIAETVLEKGGTIVPLVRNAMPTESGVAAIYRY